ncbi:MAG: cyclic nucleotide-binding domain-containing protein [Spirochaetes bacterium]|nr:cyclic nucleotide-binding domain-containing protein [Spirochaetota bacterium]
MEKDIKVINYSPGATIMVENDINEGYFYILKSGIISIQSEIIFSDRSMNKYNAGDSFGIVSGLTRNPVRFTLTADTPCEVIRIPLAKLGAYLHEQRDICLKIISSYSDELRALDSYLLKSSHPIDRLENPENLLADAGTYLELNQKETAAHCLAAYTEWAIGNNKNPKGVELAGKKLKEINPGFRFTEHSTNRLSLKKDEVVFVENEPAEYFYVIESGAVKISKLVNRQEFILSILREGEIFGEMAVLNKRVRNATASVFEDAKLMRLSVKNFMDDVGEKILASLFEIFSRRIWYAYKRASIMEMSDPNGRLYCYLQILISDINSKDKSWADERAEYIFNFVLNDLKKMIGISDFKNERIREFLTDDNIDISNHSIRIFDKRKIDDKAALYAGREKRRK